MAFWEAFFILKEPLWLPLGAFGLRLGPLCQTLRTFGTHLGHFEETFWTSESIFCLHRLNLGKPRNSLEIRSSGALWGSLDRDILAYFGPKIDPRGATRGRRGQRESKKTEKRARQRPKRQKWQSICRPTLETSGLGLDLVNGGAFGTLDLRHSRWPWLMPILANIENEIQNTPSTLPPAGGGGL